jgi:hypothetical protein
MTPPFVRASLFVDKITILSVPKKIKILSSYLLNNTELYRMMSCTGIEESPERIAKHPPGPRPKEVEAPMAVITTIREGVEKVAAEPRREIRVCEVCGVPASEVTLVGLKNDRRREGPRWCLPHHPDSLNGQRL